MFALPTWEGTAKNAIPATSPPAPDISLKPAKRDLRFMAGKAPLPECALSPMTLRRLHTVPLIVRLSSPMGLSATIQPVSGSVIAGKVDLEA